MISDKCYSIKFTNSEQLFHFFAVDESEAKEIQHEYQLLLNNSQSVITEVNYSKWKYVFWLDFSVHALYFDCDGTNEEVISVCETFTDKLGSVRISTDYLGETKNVTLRDWSRERFDKLLNGVI